MAMLSKNHVSKSGNPYLLGYNPFSKEMFKGNSELIINALHYMLGNKKLIEIELTNLLYECSTKEKIQKIVFLADFEYGYALFNRCIIWYLLVLV